jgi:hypothetical protein
LSIFPDTGQFLLARWDETTRLTLASDQSLAILLGNETNRVVLSCVGTTISVLVNGVTVAAVTDDKYAEGRMWIGAYGSATTADARLDNLVIRRSELVSLTSTPTPGVTPTAVVIATPTSTPELTTPEPTATPTLTPTVTATPLPQYDGSWGTGSGNGIPISFDVNNDLLTSLTVAYTASGTGCRLEGVVLFEPPTSASSPSGGIAFEASRPVRFRAVGLLDIVSGDGAVSVNLTGRFDSLTSATGSVEVRARVADSGLQCQAQQRGTWTATRGAAGPNPEDNQRLVR